MSLPRVVLASSRPLSTACRTTASTSRASTPARCFVSSTRIRAQVQNDTPTSKHEHHHSQGGPPEEEPPKLSKRARKVLKARQKHEDDRIAKEAKQKAKAEAKTVDDETSDEIRADTPLNGPPTIVKVKHVLDAADRKPTKREEEVNQWRRSQAQSGDESNPTAGWSGSLFRSHICALLSGFGTAPNTHPLRDNVTPKTSTSSEQHAPSTTTLEETKQREDMLPKKGITSPVMTKSERMESQARVIFQAIREARERGMVDEDESFFYPYPEGVPPKDADGKDAVWLNLGPDPEAWGRELPPVKDRWLEVLSLGLTKEISERPDDKPAVDQEELDGETEEGTYTFEDLVEDYDLEDHERLEQLGDSIVNMSSRLLAYLSYPDVNEGSLTRLSNYPTQNNFLALLFQECGLAARRDELRRELRRARFPEGAEEEEDRSNNSHKNGNSEEEKARLPLLIKRDADMFEAYAAAVFLSNGNDFNVVHEWLCGLFRPFQDQAYRFMVQRSEALARMQATRAANAAANAAAAAAAAAAGKDGSVGAATNLAADGLGIKSASVDPSSVPFSSLFPDFARNADRPAIPQYAINSSSNGEAFITDEFLTVAARARRQREERMREEMRLQNQEELMNMGWFRKGFLNLRQGFRQYVMGKDVEKEEEARLRRRVVEEKERGMSELDRQRLRAKERHQAGVSLKATGSKKKTKVGEEVQDRD